MVALSASAFSSASAGFVTVIALILISPVLITIVLLFGSPEYFLVAILGLSMITIVAQGSIVKGLVAGAFGLLLSTIGIAPMSPEVRFAFGSIELYDGLDFVAAILGIFAVAEMLKLANERGSIARQSIDTVGSPLEGVRSSITRWPLLLKSAFIGMFIGSIPGAGAAVSNFVIASTPRFFDRQANEWKDGETLFVRCSLWREAAENVAETLTKGTRVVAQGRLKSRSYDTKEGEKRTVMELEVDEVGPSLRYASAKVTRTQRGNNNGASQ